jgi:hypothetical protein
MGIFCFNSKRDLEVVGWKLLPAHCFILGSAPKAKSAFTVFHTTVSWTTTLPQTRPWYMALNLELPDVMRRALAGALPVAEDGCLFGMR